LQNSETDFNDLRNSKLIIMNGKNLVENKMADAHWFVEAMERGCKIVVIAPEYGAPSTKADYWIPVRPSTDAALWLGVTRLMMDNKWYDETFVKQFTDFPLLVRTDNGKRLRAAEVFPNYASTLPARQAEQEGAGHHRRTAPKLGRLRGLGCEVEFAQGASPATWSARRWPRAASTRRSTGRARSNWPTAPWSKSATSWNLYRVHLRTTTSTASPKSPARPRS
jgi:anaerobic selenocysteine-containing dehydrogenase